MVSELEIVARLVLSMVFGALVGLEREISKEPAGLRTHILVCLGSTIFTIISFAAETSDPTKIAAGIVTGIGFLGAGAIFKENNRVKGLTTAADLWVIASIGMAIGFGYYLMAVVAAALVMVVLIVKKVLNAINDRATMGKRLM